jgi:hypothetical protein
MMENSVLHIFSNIPKKRVFGREFGLIIQQGRSLFKNTAIVDENISFREDDIKKVAAFWIEVSPSKEECREIGDNWYEIRGSLQHFVIASQTAKHLTRKIGENHPHLSTQISPLQMELVGLLHDLGRSKTHQFYATDTLTELFMDSMAISPRIRKSLHKIEWYWEIEKPLDLDAISLAQLISVLADTLSKPSESQRRLRRPNELIQAVERGKQKYLQLPIETDLDRLVRERIEEYGKREEVVLNYAVRFMEDLGVNIEEISETLDWMVNFSGEELINKLINKI